MQGSICFPGPAQWRHFLPLLPGRPDIPGRKAPRKDRPAPQAHASARRSPAGLIVRPDTPAAETGSPGSGGLWLAIYAVSERPARCPPGWDRLMPAPASQSLLRYASPSTRTAPDRTSARRLPAEHALIPTPQPPANYDAPWSDVRSIAIRLVRQDLVLPAVPAGGSRLSAGVVCHLLLLKPSTLHPQSHVWSQAWYSVLPLPPPPGGSGFYPTVTPDG